VRKSVGARSEDGKPLPNGTEVAITRYENGIAYVKKWEESRAEWQKSFSTDDRCEQSGAEWKREGLYVWSFGARNGWAAGTRGFFRDGQFRHVVAKSRAARSADCLRHTRSKNCDEWRHDRRPNWLEQCRQLSLELMSFDVAPQQSLYTNQELQ